LTCIVVATAHHLIALTVNFYISDNGTGNKYINIPCLSESLDLWTLYIIQHSKC
jgi:hypothetical protein